MTLHHSNRAAAGNVAGSAPDAQFNYVTMLLNGDGTNGAQNNTFVDSSTNNFTITRNGNTTQGSFSPYGSNWSNYFPSVTTGLAVNNSTCMVFSGDFTIESWCYQLDKTQKVLCGQLSASNFQIQFNKSNVDGRTGIYNNSVWTTLDCSSSPVNQWFHLAYSRSGSDVYIYLNGIIQGTISVSGTLSFSGTNGGGIGALAGYWDGGWVGYLSNFQASNVAKYTGSNFTPPTSPSTSVASTKVLACQSNRFVDNSSNGFAITPNGSPSVQRFNPFGTSTAYSTSVIGGSGYFDGTGDYLSAPSNSAFAFGTGDFTIEAYVNLSVIGSNDGVLIELRSSGGTSNGFVFNCRPTTGGYLLNFYTSGSANVGSIVMPYNAWNHVAITRSGSTVRLFSNGAVSATITNSNNFSDTPTPEIGQSSLYSSSSVTGYISNMRLVKGTAVYTSAFTPPTAPLTAISGTSLLLSTINGAIYDNAMMNDLETVGNAQISTSVVKYGTGSMSFDGSGSKLKSPSLPNYNFGTGNFTIEMWVYANSIPSYPSAAFLMDSRTNASWYIFLASNALYFGDSSGTEYSGGTLTTSAWYHIAICRSSGTTKGFVNGVQAFTFSDSGSYVGSPILTVGGRYALTTYDLNGYIDDLRITTGYARYTTNFTPPTAAFPNTGPV